MSALAPTSYPDRAQCVTPIDLTAAALKAAAVCTAAGRIVDTVLPDIAKAAGTAPAAADIALVVAGIAVVDTAREADTAPAAGIVALVEVLLLGIRILSAQRRQGETEDQKTFR